MIPFIRYQNDQYLILQRSNILSQHAASIDMLFSDTYVPGLSGKGITVSVGRGAVISLAVCLFIIFTNKTSKRNLVFSFATMGLSGVLLSSSIFPWDLIQYNEMLYGIFKVLQFLWRFQLISCLFICAAIAVTLTCTEFNNKNLISCVLIVLCIISSFASVDGYSNLNAVELSNKSDNDYAYVNRDYYVYNDRTEYTSELIRYRIFNAEGNFIYYQDKKEQIIEFSDAQPDIWLELPVYYYRDLYKVTINGTEVDYGYTENNLLVVYMSETAGEIHISFSYTEFIIPYLITVLSICDWFIFV